MPRPNFQWAVGDGLNTRRVGEPEQGWLTSNAVRKWWMYFSWWVIPLGVLWFFFGPRLGHIGLDSQSATPVPQIIERVVERPVPAPAVQLVPVQQSASAPRWSSREECERHYVLTFHKAPGNRCQ